MKLELYPRLSTCSKRALTRRHYRGSRRHAPGELAVYTPRGALVDRLSRETGMNQKAVIRQLFAEREFLMASEAV